MNQCVFTKQARRSEQKKVREMMRAIHGNGVADAILKVMALRKLQLARIERRAHGRIA